MPTIWSPLGMMPKPKFEGTKVDGPMLLPSTKLSIYSVPVTVLPTAAAGGEMDPVMVPQLVDPVPLAVRYMGLKPDVGATSNVKPGQKSPVDVVNDVSKGLVTTLRFA